MFKMNSLLTKNCLEINVCLHIFNKSNITSVKHIGGICGNVKLLPNEIQNIWRIKKESIVEILREICSLTHNIRLIVLSQVRPKSTLTWVWQLLPYLQIQHYSIL